MKRYWVFPVLVGAFLTLGPSWAGCAGLWASRSPAAGPPARLALEVQERLFQQGQAYFAAHRYDQAAQVFRRLVETYPQTPLRAETHWWLGQTYEAAGRWDAALAEYRILTGLAPGSAGTVETRRQEAERRIPELERRLREGRKPAGPVVGVLIPASLLPGTGELEAWVQTLVRSGITTLLLEIGTQDPAPRGVFFRTSLADTVRAAFEEVLPVAHRQGLQVFASLTPRRMPWVDSRLGWSDRTFDDTGGQLHPSPYLDLFHPGYQEYLMGLMSDLVKTGINGVLFRNDAPPGPRDGFTAFALRGFQRDFGKALAPSQLFPGAREAGSGAAYAPEFWRWAGWKARERVKILARLVRMMRQQAPELQVALEIHPESINDPVTALVQVGEDLLEAKRSGFELFLIGPPRSGPRPDRVPDGSGGLPLGERLRELVGEPKATWVSAPLPTRDVAHLGERLSLDVDRAAPAQGMGLIYLGSPSPVP